MIRLFISHYPETDDRRRSEISECLQRNLQVAAIDEICIFLEGVENPHVSAPKIKTELLPVRPTYQDYFEWIANLAAANDISIIANADIFFSDQLKFFRHWNMPRKTVLALSRWDYKQGELPKLYDHNDSQDAWIFRGIPAGVNGGFPVGVPRCDNRIAAEFGLAGYQVLNPSFSLRVYHLHDDSPRTYFDANLGNGISPPYGYVWPHNLFGPFRTLAHNVMHSNCHLHWRFDRRKFNRWLPIRVIRKLSRVL